MGADFETVTAALTRLKTDEGAAAFIVERSGLDYERVLKIYRLGQPWPLTDDPAWDFDRQAAEAGVDWATYMAGMAPLLEMTYLDKQAKLTRMQEKLRQGAAITEEELDAFKAEFANPLLERHVTTVCTLTGEPRAIVLKVQSSAWAIPTYLCALLREAVEERERSA